MKKHPVTTRSFVPAGSGDVLSCIGIGLRGDVFVACHPATIVYGPVIGTSTRTIHRDQLVLVRMTLWAALAIVENHQNTQP
ncbi:hypothetical protein [Phnomibacter sp. MR]|uniref:hypothetical protein n=1 Tax=Phnomibacter sp. MR TaxID=3042318 RepID=UPI003A80D642